MSRKQRILLYITTIAMSLLFFFIVFGDNGLMDLNSLKKQRNSLIDENKKIQQEITSLSIETDRAKNDPAYIEAVARQDLGMIGKDEVILKFNDDITKPKNDVKQETGNDSR